MASYLETCAIGVVAAACVVAELEKPKRKKRKWMKQWLKRNELSHNALMKELALEPGDWFNYLRKTNKRKYFDRCILKFVSNS